MPIVLPLGHPRSALGVAPSSVACEPRLRIGIINIMPKLEAYEENLLAPLAEHDTLVEPVLIRLHTHGYGSSDHRHLDSFYREFDEVLAEAPLDGLILTGAPVEELPFEEVHYFRELEKILGYARTHIAMTLGLCWGGMVIGKLAGIEKCTLPRKLFGVFDDRVMVEQHDLFEGRSFPCAHSRHSGAIEDDVDAAARDGRIRLLSRGEQSGTSMFETPDGRFVAHLGHPEYNGERIAYEWERDRNLGRRDVHPPENFDPAWPVTTWRNHRRALFGGMIRRAWLVRDAVPVETRRADDASAPQYCP